MIKQTSNKFQLLDERILLKKDITRSKGSIILPSAESDQTAIVVSSACKDIPVGCRVLIGMYTGTEYEFEDGKFTMCLREHIMGIQIKE